MVTQQVLEIATLSAFTTYAVGIFEPIQMTAANIAEFISLQASIERVTGLMDQVPQVQDTPEVEAKYGDVFHPKTENWEPLLGEIEFRDVTFRYPDGGENVLEHFSLHIPAGTTVAIVGETGAGKSTLVNLACRFFEPTEGQILIDGRDYRDRSQLWLHSNIGYVLQNPHLFSGSVRENIRYGRLDATDEEVEAAARAVSADTVVAKLEKGWDSDVGEGGDRLSTGEKQLISFARAVLANPRIFVLDEATSLHRHPDRAADPGRHRPSSPGPHLLPHRPPPQHHPESRPHPGGPGRQNRGAGQAPGPPQTGRLLPRPVQQTVRRGTCSQGLET